MKILNIKKYIVIFVVLLIIDCCCSGYIGFWREKFWSAVQHKELFNFFIYIAQFSAVSLLDCFITGYRQYIGNIITLSWRTKLTRKSFILNNYHSIEGGAQRIQEDCNSYPTLMVSLSSGILRSLIMIIVFGYIIISQLPLLYIFLASSYSIAGTLIAAYIARPLIHLNYLNQVVEAKFRHLIQRVDKLRSGYKDVHNNNYNLYRYTKYLAYFQSFYGQITVIIPYIILSGLYFAGKITFGVFMQLASSMIEIINNMSYLINSFNDINRLLSCRKRLRELQII